MVHLHNGGVGNRADCTQLRRWLK